MSLSLDTATTTPRLNESQVRAIPKVELHLHLDTSVRIATVGDLGRQAGMNLPSDLDDALIVPMNCTSLNDYLSRVELEVAVLQTPEAIRRATYELLADCADDSILYAEVRFAPQLFTRQGLSLDEVIRAASAGVTDAKADRGIKGNLIMCCLRHEDEATSLAIAQAAISARNAGLPVVALDIAADETLPGHPHVKAFDLAKAAGLHRTCHAGEADGPHSIAYAIDNFGAERLGHGVRLQEDPALLEHVRKLGLALEMCPTSNVQTKATPTLADHPINRYLAQGLNVTVNCDGRTTSNTNLTHEYVTLVEQFGWGEAEIRQTAVNAARASFLPDAEKLELVAAIVNG